MAHFWKRVLKPGSYGGQNGEREVFTEDDLRQLASNGKLLHSKGVLCPLPRGHRDPGGHLPLPVMLDDADHYVDAITGGKPAWDPLVNEGFVVDWAYLDDPSAAPADLPNAEDHQGWLMGKVEVDDSNKELLDAFNSKRVRSTSLGSLRGYRLTSGDSPTQLEGRSPIHLALTLSPKVDNEAGFVAAKNEPSVALLSEEDGKTTMVELSLLSEDEDKPPQNPAVAKAKQAESGVDTPETQGDSSNLVVQLPLLIKAINESGIPHLGLPPDTNAENVIDRLITLLHNHKQENAEPDEEAPLGEPPAGSETKDTSPSLMSDEQANPTVEALLKAHGKLRQDSRRQRASALGKRNPAMAKYIEEHINPMIDSASSPTILLDDTGAMVLDPETGAPAFQPEAIDSILDGLEAAPAPSGAQYGDLTQPETDSVVAEIRGDYVADGEDETPEDRTTIQRLSAYMNAGN